jgi:hypothetical protein
MTREDLAASLIEREALAAIGDGDKTAVEAYNRLKKEGLSDDEIAVKLGDEQLANQLKSQSIQERFNASVEKLKEIFVSLAGPILQIISPFVDLATIILPLVNIALFPIINGIKVVSDGILYVVNSVKALVGALTGSNKELTVMQGIIGGIAAAYLAYQGILIATNVYQGIAAAISERKALAENASLVAIGAQKVAEAAGIGIKAASAVLSGTKAIAEVTAAEAISFGLVTLAIVGGLAAVVSAMNNKKENISPAGDMFSPADGKTQVSTKEGGLFELSPNDDFIAAPGLKDKMSKPIKSSSPTPLVIDYNKIATSIAKEINNRPVQVSVEMDGEKVAKGVGNNSTKLSNSMSTNTFQVQ